MTGLCRLVAEDLTVLESGVVRPTEVVLGGGAMAASAWWRQAFVATLAPRPVRHQRHPEIGATGAALVALGRVTDGVRISGISRTDELDSPNTVAGARPG